MPALTSKLDKASTRKPDANTTGVTYKALPDGFKGNKPLHGGR